VERAPLVLAEVCGEEDQGDHDEHDERDSSAANLSVIHGSRVSKGVEAPARLGI
jgi:hypothetical protein